jgi:two-component system, chemotaxis family, response regulator Rcp1
MQPAVSLQVAMDGDEALRMLRREGSHAGLSRPCLIFLDFNLPRSDSRDILRQLKSDVGLRTIPVAVFTTSDSEKDIQDAYALYANCYLRKPADLDGFLHTIRAAANFWLDVAQLAQE